MISCLQAVTFREPSSGWTLWHIPGREGIWGALSMARCVVEEPKSLREAICLPFENIDGLVDLSDKIIGIEVAVSIFPSTEKKACFSEGKISGDV